MDCNQPLDNTPQLPRQDELSGWSPRLRLGFLEGLVGYGSFPFLELVLDLPSERKLPWRRIARA